MIVQSFCNSCGRENDHDVVHTEERDTGTAQITISTLLCRGCREPSIRKEIYLKGSVPSFRTTPDDIEYVPPRNWHQPPRWLPQLAEVDSTLKDFLDEVYSAANSKQSRLLAMGVRTALDKVMTKVVGDFSFEEKLKKMVEAGEISPKDKEHLEIVIDAGSAAVHRHYNPPRDLLQEMIAMMEAVVRKHYLTGPMLVSMKERIPPRPTRVKPEPLPFQKPPQGVLPVPRKTGRKKG